MSSTVRLEAIANRVCGDVWCTMTQLHHPNIAQCKGVCLLVDQYLPVLLMERQMSSLHAYLLHLDNSNLGVERKVSILQDRTRSPSQPHTCYHPSRLDCKKCASGLRAEGQDSRLWQLLNDDPDSSPETLTSLPGTLAYMPPEAQGGRVMYDPI